MTIGLLVGIHHLRALQPAQTRALLAVLLLRCLFGCCVVYSLNELIGFGTSPLALSVALSLGIVLGTRLAFSQVSTRGFLTLLAIFFVLTSLMLEVIPRAVGLFGAASLGNFALSLHLYTLLYFLIFGTFTTWLFWRLKHTLTAEMLLLLIACVSLFAAHRNFHFDSPQIINSLAWWLRVDQITLLVALGVSFFVLITSYAYVASSPQLPSPRDLTFRTSTGRPHVPALIILIILFLSVLFLIAKGIHAKYAYIAKSRAANGVGESTTEGMSPLSFHSALGSTNQPAALVRLEGDYTDNPFLPMLYFRESALSQFNGKELTMAPRVFDSDVPFTSPQEAFKSEEDPRLEKRKSLTQSAYLLTEHKLSFGIDYPISIVPLKNPNPGRFKAAFRTYSMVPAFKLSELATQPVGDPKWSDEVTKHFLLTHPDPRYAEKAREITAGLQHPLEQAVAIIQYLNKTAIYTLTPNHNVEPQADPVAPFLFGDHRGYCVHFAHAITYMLRALGIPARIATGYMTDLSQARDGHILLRMSDRHAWAEAYVQDFGWIPIDIQPEQVESHADTQVDMKVLEELMDLLGPGEEVLPQDLLKDEKSQQEPNWQNRNLQLLWWLLVIPFVAGAYTKVLVRLAWKLPASPQKTIQRGYNALASKLFDYNIRRKLGETRKEFHNRIRKEHGIELAHFTDALDVVRFASPQFTQTYLSRNFRSTSQVVNASIPSGKFKQVLAIINPASVLHVWGGGRW